MKEIKRYLEEIGVARTEKESQLPFLACDYGFLEAVVKKWASDFQKNINENGYHSELSEYAFQLGDLLNFYLIECSEEKRSAYAEDFIHICMGFVPEAMPSE